MIELKAPKRVPYDYWDPDQHFVSYFLAGSIEMGAAELWQDKVARKLADREDIVLFNPRRDDWDASWEQSINNKQFKQQVDWELEHIELADFVVFYFDPNTKAPITLLELGLVAGKRSEKYLDNQTICVCCPPGFYRRGNVEIVCDRHNIKLVDTLDELINWMSGEPYADEVNDDIPF
jgi:hypothetical protein